MCRRNLNLSPLGREYDVKDKTDAYVSIYFPTTKNRRTASTIYNYVKM